MLHRESDGKSESRRERKGLQAEGIEFAKLQPWECGEFGDSWHGS